MTHEVTKVRLFVASPGDVRAERDMLNSVVNELNYTTGLKLDFVIELVRWETHCRPGLGRAQEVINEQIGPYDIFLGIMWKRFGTPTGDADSGTEEEFNLAYQEWEKNKKLQILFYFCQAPYNYRSQDELDQQSKVLKFHNSLKDKALVWEYENRDTFADTVRPHLSNLLLDMFSNKIALPAERDLRDKLRQVQEGLNKLNPNYQVAINTVNEILILPKHPEADQQSPQLFSGTIKFPDTPEGRERHEEFKRAMATGTPVTIPDEYIKGPLPDLLAPLLSPEGRGRTSLTIGSIPSDRSILLKAKLDCVDGTNATLDYIHLQNTQQGSEEITFNNSKQALPWKFELVLAKEGVRWSIKYSTKTELPNAKRELDAIRFGEAMSKGGTLRMEYADTGLDLPEINVSPGVFPQPDARWKQIIEKLVLIQEKVQIPLAVPMPRNKESRTIAAEDIRKIFETAQKLETGRTSLELVNWETAVDASLARKLIDLFGKGEPVSLSFSSDDDVVNLFGIDISLGPFVYTCQQTLITEQDLEALKERTAQANEGQSIPVRFTPLNGAPMLVHYLNWLPPNDRDFLLNQMRRDS